MKNRCLNPNAPDYRYYGGRGITICDKWVSDFEAFAKDVGARPEGYTLERIDNDRGYEPGNIRWASRQEQASNRRDNVFIDWRGESLTMAEAARRIGIAPASFIERLQRGWPIERVMTTPPLRYSKRP